MLVSCKKRVVMKLILLFFFLFISHFSFSQDIRGWWHGKVNLMGTSLRVSLDIQPKDEDWSVVFLSPDQGNDPINGGSITIKGDSIFVRHEKMKVWIEGLYDDANQKINAQFFQMGINSDLELGRDTIAKTTPKRPQTPTNFDSFYTEDITIENKEANIHLSGTLSLPSKSGKHPVVILASGSGPTNRDADLLGHQWFKVLAWHLAEKGIGCIRFDDRGVGKSEGNHREGTVKDFGSDVKAVFEYAKKRNEFSTIGLLGHSEGGMHIMLANKALKGQVDFLIFLACVGVKGEEVYLKQHKLVGEKTGLTALECERNVALFKAIIAAGRKEKYPGPTIDKLTGEAYDALDEKTKFQTGNKMRYIATIMAFANNEWFRQFMDFEPKKYFKYMKQIPVLILNGTEDIQVDCEQNTTGFEAGLTKVKAQNFTIHKMKQMNHLFQRCKTCSISEYGRIETTIEPEVLNTISDWMNKLN